MSKICIIWCIDIRNEKFWVCDKNSVFLKLFRYNHVTRDLFCQKNIHSFIKSWFFGMQQFSFNPAPLNQFNKYLINRYILYKGMSFTLRQIRINGNLNPRGIQWYIWLWKNMNIYIDYLSFLNFFFGSI